MFEAEKRRLARRDPKLREALKHGLELEPDRDYFRALCQSIVWQQLAGKAAQKIWDRLAGTIEIEPEKVVSAGPEKLRSAGLSSRKAGYLIGIAQAFVDGTISRDFAGMDDEQVIAELTKLRGVGRWTAEMFLIFSLGRMDIFAADDYGLRKAVQKLYGLEQLPGRAELEEITSRWKPYRTVASLALWKWMD